MLNPTLGVVSPSMQAVSQLQDKQFVCLGTGLLRGPGQSKGFCHLYPGLFDLACSATLVSSPSDLEDLPQTHPCKKSHLAVDVHLENKAIF